MSPPGTVKRVKARAASEDGKWAFPGTLGGAAATVLTRTFVTVIVRVIVIVWVPPDAAELEAEPPLEVGLPPVEDSPLF
jgi:hypothetical protein